MIDDDRESYVKVVVMCAALFARAEMKSNRQAMISQYDIE